MSPCPRAQVCESGMSWIQYCHPWMIVLKCGRERKGSQGQVLPGGGSRCCWGVPFISRLWIATYDVLSSFCAAPTVFQRSIDRSVRLLPSSTTSQILDLWMQVLVLWILLRSTTPYSMCSVLEEVVRMIPILQPPPSVRVLVSGRDGRVALGFRRLGGATCGHLSDATAGVPGNPLPCGK